MKTVSRRTQFSSSALPPAETLKAIPRYISRKTSYYRVRLEFLSHPQLISACCTAREFGPPPLFLKGSSWSWIAHPVSGYMRATKRPLRLAFAAPPPHKGLSIATHNILAGSFFNRNTVTRARSTQLTTYNLQLTTFLLLVVSGLLLVVCYAH